MLASSQVARPRGALPVASGSPIFAPHGETSRARSTVASLSSTQTPGSRVSRYRLPALVFASPVSMVHACLANGSPLGSKAPSGVIRSRGRGLCLKKASGSLTSPPSFTPWNWERG